MENRKRLPCGAVFRSPVIRADGSVTVCNYDLTLELKLGNIDEDNIFNLWESEKIENLRKCHLFNSDLPDKCRKCNPDYFLSRRQSVNLIKKEYGKEKSLEFLIRTFPKPKILLVNPLVSPKAPFKTCVSLGLGSIATYISPFYEVEILNMNYSGLDNFSVASYIEDNGFNIVGVTAMTYQIMGALRLLNVVKERSPEVITVAGGVFSTMAYDFVMQNEQVDILLRGEGEKAFLDLLRNFENGKTDLSDYPSIVYRKDGKIKENEECDFLEPDDIPLVNRKIMPSLGFLYDDNTFGNKPEEQIACVVMFSRGCPSNCIFCESPHMWKKKVRLMSIDRIIKEIRYIIAEYGIRNFVIDDDSFTVFRDKIMEFCDRVIEEKLDIRWRCNTKVNLVNEELFTRMKQAGCVKVTYGIEAGNPEVLKNLKKSFTIDQVRNALRLNRKCDLPASMLMIIGSPGETSETINDSLSLIQELEPEGGWDFQIMQPHPGTTLRRDIDKYGGKILTNDWDEYYSDNITYIPEGFEREDFLYWCKKVTSRPITIAGEEKISFSREEGNTVRIPVDLWDHGEFDKLRPFYWTGEKDFQKGYTHVLGGYKGFLKYNFVIEKIPEYIIIRFSACSQKVGERSFINVRLNKTPVGSLYIGPKDSYGFDYEIFVGKEIVISHILKGVNELYFEVPEKVMPNGISIMYKALENSLPIQEKPIMILLGGLKDV